MSTPASQPAPQPGQQQASRPAQQAGQQSGQPGAQGQGQGQPGKASPAKRVTSAVRHSSTPTQMRWARGIATIAAALSGLVATGSFDTDGLNATPHVIAQQWSAAERAGVHVAEGDVAAVEGIAAAATGEEVTTDPAEVLGRAAGWHARSGAVGQEEAGAVAESLTGAAVLTDQALRQAELDRRAALETYASAHDRLTAAGTTTRSIAEQRATELETGSRSALTATVGGLATAILVLVMVWLALRTRRIVNIPLAVATLITAGLTYLSFNPSALPVNYDQRMGQASRDATALRETYEARRAQYATVLGLPDPHLDAERNQAQRAIAAAGDPAARDAWRAVDDALQDLPEDDVSAGVSAIRATGDDYDRLVGSLEERMEDGLSDAGAQIGTPATITSGGALLLGLVAAALAWAGLTQRLRDYR